MENSYKFFENRGCKYFPCHKGLEHFNCMFCYCPMYNQEKCLGNPSYIEKGDRKVKDCSQCSFPHVPENYEAIIAFLRKG
ncbi:MAG: cysteine-rich small domain-containing protein [Eubacterium sp.]|nr:cysteine-rich small domain-containing protein [Eubacterium sp.]